MDSRSFRARSLLHFAGGHDPLDHAANRTQPGTTRPDASQNDVDHALGVQRDVLLFSIGFGALLDYQQHFVNCTAVGHQHQNGCTASVQSAKIQLSALPSTAGPLGLH